MPTKRGGADRRLEQRAEHVEREHVQRQVQQAGVQEGRGEDPVGLAFGHRARPKRPAVDDHRAAAVERGGTAAADELGDEREHAEADQGEGRRGVARARGAGRAAHLGPLARALRAAHPDRGRGHAVGADRPPAVRAGDVGLAPGMSVTGRHEPPDDIGAPLPQGASSTAGRSAGWLPGRGSAVTRTASRAVERARDAASAAPSTPSTKVLAGSITPGALDPDLVDLVAVERRQLVDVQGRRVAVALERRRDAGRPWAGWPRGRTAGGLLARRRARGSRRRRRR